MKVCLIDTAAINSKRSLPHWNPLNLAYIAAMLERSGHEVMITERDVLFRKNWLNIEKVDWIMEQGLRSFSPDLMGISSPTELFPEVVRAAHIAKLLFPNVPVVYGGHHASAVPIGVLEVCKDIDIVAVGEGEITMLELADGLKYEHIKGICFRKGKSLIKNPPRPVIATLDDLPMPARHLLDMDFHTKPSPYLIRNLTLKATTMLTSRGCPFSCSFCVESLTTGKKHRVHSPSRVIAELEHNLSKYSIEAIYFLDEGFLTDPSRVNEMCAMMIRDGYHRRVKWAAQVRVDSLNQDMVKLMREAGCMQLECGFETASDRLLKRVKKGTSSQKNQEIIGLIKSSGIRCLANIIFGLPGETEEEFHHSVEFIRNAGVDAVVFSRFSPHPGSVIYGELVEKGLIQEKFWENDGRCYEKMNFTAMPNERFTRLYKSTKEGLIDRINTKDRMMNTLLLRTIINISFRELLSIVLHDPLSIPRFIFNWLKIRLLNKISNTQSQH